MVQRLFEAAIAMGSGSFLSIILTRFLGQTLDHVVDTLIQIGMYDVPPLWQTDSSTLINLFYIICMLPAVLGLLTAILLTQRRTEVAAGFGATEEIQVEEL